jgi:LacI family transcriptional regulator
VSTATASHALNNTRSVGKAARQQVLDAAKALGYQPNFLARSLKMGSSRLIGCLVNSLSNPFISATVEGAHTVLRNQGYGLLVYRTGPQSSGVTDGVRFAESYHAAGLLVVHPRVSESRALRRWAAAHQPLVLAIHRDPTLAADTVTMAHEEAGYDATRYLLEQGHRRIAVLSRPTRLEVYALITAGYHRALRDQGIEPQRALLRCDERTTLPDAQQELGYREMLALLALPKTPTAILCSHNQIAIGALRALRERGLNVPKQISLMTFDHVDWMRVTEPALTSIGVHGDPLGQAAAHALLDRLAGAADPPRIIHLPMELAVRDSVAPPPRRGGGQKHQQWGS